MIRILRTDPKLPLALGILFSIAVSASAFAEPGGVARTEAERERARELMREGNELYGAGKLSDAYGKYIEAWRTAQTYDIACNLGGTASELSMNRDAAEYLDYCLRHYAASSRPEAVAAERRARAAFEVVRTKVAAVTVQVTPAGSEVFVDGAKVGRAPLEAPVYLEAGPHRIEARYPDRKPVRADLDAKRGETTEITLELEPPASPSSDPAPAPPQGESAASEADPHTGSKNYVPAIITASAGGAALATGVVFLVLRSGKQSEASEKLDGLGGENPCGEGTAHTTACAEIANLSDQAATFGTLSLVSFGVAAGAGVATFFLWPRAGGATSGGSLRPSVVGSADGIYASLRGSF